MFPAAPLKGAAVGTSKSHARRLRNNSSIIKPAARSICKALQKHGPEALIRCGVIDPADQAKPVSFWRHLESLARATEQCRMPISRDGVLPLVARSKKVTEISRLLRTRIPVWLLEQSRRLGTSEQALLAAYPSLLAEDLVNAWAYARSHAEEIESQIRENEAA